MTARKSENEVLKPKDPAIASENDWPEFQLRNVEVRNESKSLSNLLHVDEANPVTVTGDLVAFDEIQPYCAFPVTTGDSGKLILIRMLRLVLPSKEPRIVQLPIKIENVSHFSYGAYENGDVDIWAAGAAGWYRLQPATTYSSTFHQMQHAVKFFYFIADAYIEQPKIAVNALFDQYTRKRKCSPGQAKRDLAEYRKFLASRMEKGAEDIKWNHTPIYQHLRKTHPDAFDIVKPAAEVPRRSKSQSQAKQTPTLENESRKVTRRSRRGESNSDDDEMAGNGRLYRNDHASYKLQKDAVKAQVNALWTLMQNVASRETNLTLATIARAAYRHFTFDDEVQATDYIAFFAPELVSKIQHKHIGKQQWTESIFYSELLDAELSRSTRAKISQLKVQKRPEGLSYPESNDEDDDISSNAEVRYTRRSRHAKGGLRPKGSGKGTGKKGKSYTGPAIRTAVDLDDTSEASTPRKRKNTSGDGNQAKRTRSIALSSDATTPQSQEQGSEDDEVEDQDYDEGQDKDQTLISPPPLSSLESTVLTLHSTPSHDTCANSPGDQYSCPHPGCNRVVYGASSELGQQLISEHLADHDEKLRLVVNEKNLTNLPVGNLIRRIREMAAFQDSGGFGMGPMVGREVVQRAL